jgi:hypothetical protein
MKLRQLKNLDKDDILGALGLQTRQSTGTWFAGAMGIFGVGVLMGAGLALLLAPKPGSELRRQITDRLRTGRNGNADTLETGV